MPVDLRQLGTPIETKDGAQSKADAAEDSAINYTDSEITDHENSTSGVHGVGGSDVASTADVDDVKGQVQIVETLDDLPDADEEKLGTRYFVEEENQSYEVTADE